MSDSIDLKWGTLKGWSLESEGAMAALRKYHEAGTVLMSVAMQRDTPEQKVALCELIDACDGEIFNDWSGEIMAKEEAKKYVMEFGK